MANILESSLAYPLVGSQEVQAAYKYNFAYSFNAAPQSTYDLRYYHRNTATNTWDELPLESTYRRQKWIVGIGYNTFRFVRGSLPGHLNFLGVHLLLAHWGVYLRPANVESEEERPYYMFGMNFRDDSREELLLEHTWRTKEGGSTRLKDSDFKKHGERQYTDVEIYCSLEEFVLTAQMILTCICFDERNLYGREHQKGKMEDIFAGLFINGQSYELLRRNCQHFSKTVFEYLYQCKWTDPERLNTEFSLQNMQYKIRNNSGNMIANTLRKVLIAPEKEYQKKIKAFRRQIQRTGQTEVRDWEYFMKMKDIWRSQHLFAIAQNLHTKEDYQFTWE